MLNSREVPGKSGALEPPFYLSLVQGYKGRTPVRAGGGIFRLEKVADKSFGLDGTEFLIGPNRTVTRYESGGMFPEFTHRREAFSFLKPAQKISDEKRRLLCRQFRRKGENTETSRPGTLDFHTYVGERLYGFMEDLCFPVRQVKRNRVKQTLIGRLLLQGKDLLEKDSLVSGVLVDQQKTVGAYENEISSEELEGLGGRREVRLRVHGGSRKVQLRDRGRPGEERVRLLADRYPRSGM